MLNLKVIRCNFKLNFNFFLLDLVIIFFYIIMYYYIITQKQAKNVLGYFRLEKV